MKTKKDETHVGLPWTLTLLALPAMKRETAVVVPMRTNSEVPTPTHENMANISSIFQGLLLGPIRKRVILIRERCQNP